MKIKIILLIAGIILGIFGYYLFLPLHIPISPITSTVFPKTYLLEPKTTTILGFLPYWNVKKASDTALSSITDLAYFALQLQKDGSIQTKINSREEEPGWTNYKKMLLNPKLHQKPLHLVFMATDNDLIDALLTSPKSRKEALGNIEKIATESNAIGVNIDFEPSGGIPTSMRDNFTVFVSELKQSLPSNIKLSIDVYGVAATRPKLWDLVKLAPILDYIVIMTYDYFQPSSSQSGPVAPLRGSPQLFDEDVIKNLSETILQVPANKILLGIPFYGYEWTTSTNEKYSSSLGRGVTASLERVDKLITEKMVEVLWDRNSLTPYLVVTEGNITSQIYFENSESIRLKAGLAKSAGLAGVAIWAIGYEGSSPTLWSTLQNTLK